MNQVTNSPFRKCQSMDCPDFNLKPGRMFASSLEELRLALRLLDEPYHNRSAESCIVHLNQAWLYLFQLSVKLDGNCVISKGEEGHYIDMRKNTLLANSKPSNESIEKAGANLPLYRKQRMAREKSSDPSIASFSAIFHKIRVERHPAGKKSPKEDSALIPTPAYCNLMLLSELRNQVEHRAVMHYSNFTFVIMPYIVANVYNYLHALERAYGLLTDNDKNYVKQFYPEVANDPNTNLMLEIKKETKFPLMYLVTQNDFTLETYRQQEKKAILELKKEEPEMVASLKQANDYISKWRRINNKYPSKIPQSYTEFKSILHTQIIPEELGLLTPLQIRKLEPVPPVAPLYETNKDWLNSFNLTAKDIAIRLTEWLNPEESNLGDTENDCAKKEDKMKFTVRQDEVKTIAEHLKVRLDRPDGNHWSDFDSCIYLAVSNRFIYSITFFHRIINEIPKDMIEDLIKKRRSTKSANMVS